MRRRRRLCDSCVRFPSYPSRPVCPPFASSWLLVCRPTIVVAPALLSYIDPYIDPNAVATWCRAHAAAPGSCASMLSVVGGVHRHALYKQEDANIEYRHRLFLRKALERSGHRCARALCSMPRVAAVSVFGSRISCHAERSRRTRAPLAAIWCYSNLRQALCVRCCFPLLSHDRDGHSTVVRHCSMRKGSMMSKYAFTKSKVYARFVQARATCPPACCESCLCAPA